MKEWFKARNIWGAAITALSDDEAGRLVKAIWAYTMDHEVIEIQGAGKGIFAMIRMTLDQDEEHDSYVSKVRSEATESRRKQKISDDIAAEQGAPNDIKINQMISNDIKNPNKNKNKSKNKEQETEYMFERFWAAYPRHDSKATARRAFEKLKPTEELLGTMLSAIDKYKQTAQWQENGGQFIPYAATWLNQKRWEDDVKTGQPCKVVTAQQYSQRDYSGEQEEAMKRMIEMEGA